MADKKTEKKPVEKVEKKEEPKVEKKEAVKVEKPKKYSIAVTGFYALGKMFRPSGGNEIDSKRYADYIEKWLAKGYIR